MISSSNRISRREEINELFEQLGQVLEERVEALLIGGAVMLELGLKDATKDIDVVCRSEEDKERLLAAAKALGFEIIMKGSCPPGSLTCSALAPRRLSVPR